MEIHILPGTTRKEIDELPSIVSELKEVLKISGIHLDTMNESVFIESIHKAQDDERLLSIFKVAQEIADIQRDRVMIVTHTDMSKQATEVYPESMTTLVNWLKWFNVVYPSVDLSVENLSPITVREGEGLKATNSFVDGNVEVVEFLRDMGVQNIYTTLDVAHTAISINVINTLVKGGLLCDGIVMEDIIKRNSLVCNNVHFATNIGMGLAREDHGVAFTPCNYEHMNKLYNLIATNMPNSQLTLEVQEADYTYAINATTMQEAIRRLEPHRAEESLVRTATIINGMKNRVS